MKRDLRQPTNAERLLVWQGALPFDPKKEPERLASWSAEQGAGAVVLDSLKDVAAKLSDEEEASKLNLAFQACVNSGVELLVLHHPRKANAVAPSRER